MAAIFPPAGKPPGPAICNGFTPHHRVIGEGPLYAPADCTSVLTDCTFNAIVSEILAAVDALGYAYNTGRVDNLGEALLEKLDELNRRFNNKLDRTGDTMEGPLTLARDPQGNLEAATKRYVDERDNALENILRTEIGDQGETINAAWAAAVNAIDARKVNRNGDAMSGRLLLSDAVPLSPLEAASKAYVDNAVEMGGGGGPGGGEIPEAPTDGKTYGRGLLAWHAVPQEAPEDDHVYGRINRAWVRLMDDGEY